jgi:short chain dehydrogenase
MGKLDGRVAIITGGSGGIGRAAAKRFVDEGANVLLVDIEERALRDSVNAIGEKHASWICADVTSDDDTQGYVKAAVERYGRIDQRSRRVARSQARDPCDGEGWRRKYRDYIIDCRHPWLRRRIGIRDEQACCDRNDAHGGARMRAAKDPRKHRQSRAHRDAHDALNRRTACAGSSGSGQGTVPEHASPGALRATRRGRRRDAVPRI